MERHSYNTRSSTAVAAVSSQQLDNDQFNTLISMMQNMQSAFQTVNTTVESMRADMGSLTQRIIILEDKHSSKHTSRGRSSKSSATPSLESTPYESTGEESVCSVEISSSNENLEQHRSLSVKADSDTQVIHKREEEYGFLQETFSEPYQSVNVATDVLRDLNDTFTDIHHDDMRKDNTVLELSKPTVSYQR